MAHDRPVALVTGSANGMAYWDLSPKAAPGVWGANTPSRRLTCDVLSQPTFSCRIRTHYC